MRDSNKDLDFLHEVARMISERSKEDSPISPGEVLDLFHDTFEKMTDIRTIEVPIFMPVMIEKKDDLYMARCHVYRLCQGIGRSEEEAIEKLKKEIDLFNKSSMEAEKRMRIEEIVRNLFPKNRL